MTVLAFTLVELLVAVGVAVVLGGAIVLAIGSSARVVVTPPSLALALNSTAQLTAAAESRSSVLSSWGPASGSVTFAASGVKVGINGPRQSNAAPGAPAVATIAGVAEGTENVTVSVTIGKDKGSVAVPVTVT